MPESRHDVEISRALFAALTHSQYVESQPNRGVVRRQRLPRLVAYTTISLKDILVKQIRWKAIQDTKPLHYFAHTTEAVTCLYNDVKITYKVTLQERFDLFKLILTYTKRSYDVCDGRTTETFS